MYLHMSFCFEREREGEKRRREVCIERKREAGIDRTDRKCSLREPEYAPSIPHTVSTSGWLYIYV